MAPVLPETSTNSKILVTGVTSLVTLFEMEFRDSFTGFLKRYIPGITPEIAVIFGIILGIVLALIVGVILSYLITSLVNRLLWGTQTDRAVRELSLEMVKDINSELKLQYDLCVKEGKKSQEAVYQLLQSYAVCKVRGSKKRPLISSTLSQLIQNASFINSSCPLGEGDLLKPLRSILKARAEKKLLLVFEHYNLGHLGHSFLEDNGSFLRRSYRYLSLPKDHKEIISLFERKIHTKMNFGLGDQEIVLSQHLQNEVMCETL